jgi:hypothetical protein
MKITRKTLLIITASLGVLLIVYSLVRHFFKIGLSDTMEKYFMDGVVFGALALFMYNRKLAKDERLAKEAAEKEALNPPEPVIAEEDKDLPHWERQANAGTGESEESSAEDEDSGDASAED